MGNAFLLELPCLVAPAGPPPSTPASVGLKGHRALVVDDEAAIREYESTLLAELGHEVLTAGDGAEAVLESSHGTLLTWAP